ncbi:hypothetical protein Bca4012_037676 [Brassica carinata]
MDSRQSTPILFLERTLPPIEEEPWVGSDFSFILGDDIEKRLETGMKRSWEKGTGKSGSSTSRAAENKHDSVDLIQICEEEMENLLGTMRMMEDLLGEKGLTLVRMMEDLLRVRMMKDTQNKHLIKEEPLVIQKITLYEVNQEVDQAGPSNTLVEAVGPSS